MLEMNTRTEGEILLVDLQGVLDSQTAGDFKAWMEEKIIEGYSRFGLNCHHLKYLSSRGIGALMELSNLLKKKGGMLALYLVRSEVFKLLQFLRLHEEISIHEDEDETVSSLQRGAGTGGAPLPEPEIPVREEMTPGEELIPETPAKKETATGAEKHFDLLNDEFAAAGSDWEPQAKKKFLIYDESETVEDREAAPVSGKTLVSDFDREISEPDIRIPDTENRSQAPLSLNTRENSAAERERIIIEPRAQREEPQAKAASGATIYCPNCGKKLRVNRPGKFLCPSCRNAFQYPF